MLKEKWVQFVKENKPDYLEKYSIEKIPNEIYYRNKLELVCLKHLTTFLIKPLMHVSCLVSCPDCRLETQRAAMVKDDSYFINEFKKISPPNLTFLSFKRSSNSKSSIRIKFSCAEHGCFGMTWQDFRSRAKVGRNPCKFCCEKTRREEILKTYLDRAKEKHQDYYDYSRVSFVTVNDKVEIICPKHGTFSQTLASHAIGGNKCPKCATEGRSNGTDTFKQKAKKIHGERYDYSLVECKKNTDFVDIICPKHGTFRQIVHSHLEGCGCPKCGKEVCLKGTEKFIKEAREVHGNKYNYSLVNYTGQRVKVKIQCPIHGLFLQTPFSHIVTRSGCPRCRESYGERRVAMFLEKHGIKYIKEFKLEGSLFRYDFYLPDFDTLIEFHGIQHYRPVERFGGRKAFDRAKERDEKKIFLANERNKRLIILNYDSLRCKDIDKSFTNRFKRKGLYWCKTSSGFRIFENIFDITSFYEIKENFNLKDIVDFIKKHYDPLFNILF